MIPPTTFGIMAIPLAIFIYILTEWKNAKKLLESINSPTTPFNKFKKKIFEENYEWTLLCLIGTGVFFLLILIILCFASLISNDVPFLSYFIGISILGCFTFLIISTIFVKTSSLEPLKTISLKKFITNNEKLEDIEELLSTQCIIKDEILKKNIEEILVQFFLNNMKKK